MKQYTLLTSLIFLIWSAHIHASSENEWQWQIHTSAYTQHYSHNPLHNNHQRLINLEAYNPNDWLTGIAVFDNSFNQPSQYLYVGRSFHPINAAPDLHLKVTGGLIHGYKAPYKDKIPLNALGVAPAILPSIGYSYKKATSELIFLGTAGIMVTVGYKF